MAQDDDVPIEMVAVKLEVEDDKDRKYFIDSKIELKQEPMPWNCDLDPLSDAHANGMSVKEEESVPESSSTILGIAHTFPSKRMFSTKSSGGPFSTNPMAAEVSSKGKAADGSTKLPKYLSCPQCAYITENNMRYLRHLLTHPTRRDKTCACIPCATKGKAPVGSTKRPKYFCCPQCSYVTENNWRYEKHILTHQPCREKPFACTKCEYKADRKQVLQRHLETHFSYKDQPFACRVCQYTSHDKGQFRKHMLIHEDLRNMIFNCFKCRYRTNRKSRLDRHMFTHRSDAEKLFACSQCCYRTARSDLLKRHLAKHS